jgi:predicted metalloprotease with PDZ domain
MNTSIRIVNLPVQKYRILMNIILGVVILASWKSDLKKEPSSRIEYTISMENPNNHYFHVSLTYTGMKDKTVEFKLPSWTPGYYMIMDYAKNIVNFKAFDINGKNLPWKKTEKNRWEVNSITRDFVKVSYDVYSFRISVADSFLDDGRGFISPTGIYMHPAGEKDHPVSVTVIPYEKFTKVSTGLDPVPDIENTFFAADFDVLYDSPILAGNHEILSFEIDGIPYSMAVENLGNIDRSKFIEDHKKIIEAATAVVGEKPYKHYTFLIMNRGGGGLEHTNSMAVFSNPSSFDTRDGYKRWLGFVAHEFFHLYNVKTIRPEELGPFDYDEENYTTMLWFSEGVTSYYQNLILNRAGLCTREDVLNELQRSIANYENIPGHLFQSAAQSSFDAWLYFLNRSENSFNTTISYYDKGCALGMLLDLKIRYESDNKRSLDDVMKTLYMVYYKEKNRGFTDKEFRDICEKIADCSLDEIFDTYVSTTQDIDYPKYLAYAGLSINTSPVLLPGGWLGISTREEADNLMITAVEWNSPGYWAGLSPQDVIKEIDGVKATKKLLNERLSSAKPGDKITISVTHREIFNTYEIILGERTTRSFEIIPLNNPTAQQSVILNKWLK